MVRFIMRNNVCNKRQHIRIYIPIWLDLLLLSLTGESTARFNLHSNMVRFIINFFLRFLKCLSIFTFQYGQIYYKSILNNLQEPGSIYIPIWLDLLYIQHSQIRIYKNHLHSNMVRFIILVSDFMGRKLDNLHSNMVRFIIDANSNSPKVESKFTFQYGQIYYPIYINFLTYYIYIYIPIWLDLLFYSKNKETLSCYIYIPIWLDLLSI